MKTTIITILWIACGIGAAGMANANLRVSLPKDGRNVRMCEFSIGIGLLFGPLAIPISMMKTDGGFAYDGWTLDCGKVDKP